MECEAFQSSKPAPIAGLSWQPVKPEPMPPNFPEQNFGMSIPPPPPPTAWPSHGTAEMDSDSLYSMLMSWYMAGYHTGLNNLPLIYSNLLIDFFSLSKDITKGSSKGTKGNQTILVLHEL